MKSCCCIPKGNVFYPSPQQSYSESSFLSLQNAGIYLLSMQGVARVEQVQALLAGRAVGGRQSHTRLHAQELSCFLRIYLQMLSR